MIELLRGVAAFLAAPLLLHLATTTGSDAEAGLRNGLWACVGLVAFGLVAIGALWLSARAPLRTPRVEHWLEGEGPAIEPRPLAAALRGV